MVLEWFANYYKRDVTIPLYVWERPQRNPNFVCRFEHGSCILSCKKVEELARKVIHSKKSCNQFWTTITLSAPNPLWRDSSTHTGFPKKDARLSKLKNIPDLLIGEKEGKIMKNIDFSYFSNRATFMANPVAFRLLCHGLFSYMNK